MRILAFSDLHRDAVGAARLVGLASDADLVIGAGDFATMRQGLDAALAPFQTLSVPFVLVPGNAESIQELEMAAVALPTAVVLHGGARMVSDLTLFGLGYAVPVTPFGDWSCDLAEEAAAEMLADLPPGSVLVSHSPPHGVADMSGNGAHIGSTAVREAVLRAGPRLVLCGHVHNAWGETGQLGAALVVNCGPEGVWIELGSEGAPRLL